MNVDLVTTESVSKEGKKFTNAVITIEGFDFHIKPAFENDYALFYRLLKRALEKK